MSEGLRRSSRRTEAAAAVVSVPEETITEQPKKRTKTPATKSTMPVPAAARAPVKLSPEELFRREIEMRQQQMMSTVKTLPKEARDELLKLKTLFTDATVEDIGDERRQLSFFCQLWRMYPNGLSFTINKFCYTPANYSSGSYVLERDNPYYEQYLKDKPELIEFIKTKTPKLVRFTKYDYDKIEEWFQQLLGMLTYYFKHSYEIKEIVEIQMFMNFPYKISWEVYRSKQEFYTNINKMCLIFQKWFDLSFEYKGTDTYIYTVKENETKRFLRGVHDKAMTTINPSEKTISYLSTTIDESIANSYTHHDPLGAVAYTTAPNEMDPAKIYNYVEEFIPAPGTKCIDMNYSSEISGSYIKDEVMMEYLQEFVFPRGLTITTSLPFEEHPQFPTIIQRYIAPGSTSAAAAKGGKRNKIRKLKKTMKLKKNKISKGKTNKKIRKSRKYK